MPPRRHVFDAPTLAGMFGGLASWLAAHLDVITGVVGLLGALGGLAVVGFSASIKLYQWRATRAAYRAGNLRPPEA